MLESEELDHLLSHPIPTDFRTAAELIGKIGRLCAKSGIHVGLRRRAVRRIGEIREKVFLVGLN